MVKRNNNLGNEKLNKENRVKWKIGGEWILH